MNYILSVKKESQANDEKVWVLGFNAKCQLCGAKLAFSKDKKGKPIVYNSSSHFISISNSKQYISRVISHMPIGTDIEYKKVRSPELFDYIADFDEQRLLKRLGKEGLLACWTAKEAAQKADSKLFDIRQYKITSTNASKLTFSISRAGKRWSGKWIITEEFVCTLAIQA